MAFTVSFVAVFWLVIADASAVPPGDLAALLARPMVTPSDFKLIGGWKVNDVGAGGSGMGYDVGNGNMFVEHGSGDTRYITMPGKSNQTALHRFSVSLSNLGTDPIQHTTWPLTTPVQLMEQANHPACGAQLIGGVTRPNGVKYLTSGRVGYASEPYAWIGPWMSWVDEKTGLATAPLSVPKNVNDRAGYGEGFVDIPRWFADAYLEGRNFGVGKGGYRSGQNSCPGPSLFVCDRPVDGQTALTNATPLIRYLWTGSLSVEQMKASRPKRPADYGTPLWGPPVENGEGWTQADECHGGWFWVDTPTKQGLCSIMLQGLGNLNYGLQDDTFSTTRRLRLYTYSPQELISVIQGKKQPYQTTPNAFYEWPHPFFPNQDHMYRSWPSSIFYDPVDNYLYVSYQFSGGQQYESTPVICVYSIIEAKLAEHSR